MKEIFILSCWPDNKHKEEQLLTLIAKLKKLGKEILIASHYPVPNFIINQVDYYIYDKTNTIYTNKTLETYPADYYFNNENFRIEAVNIDHSAALSRIFNIALNFIKNLEYDYFTIMESDVEFDTDDLKKLDNIKSNLIENNKKLFFFKIRPYEFPYWENNGIFEVYATVCFGGFLKEFNSKLIFPQTLDEWNRILLKDKKNHNLEYLVTEAFKNYKDNYYILDSIFYEFSNSKINTSSVSDIDGVYYNIKNRNLPILFLHNGDSEVKTHKISISAGLLSTYEREINLSPRQWWFDYIDISECDKKIKVSTYVGNKIVKNINVLINQEWINREKNRRQFSFK
jgi:hypothetical protein